VITPWAFGHFLLRSQGVFALPVGKDSTQRSVQFSGAGSEEPDLDVIIDYVFTLKMRPTRVELRLLRSSTSPRQYVAIRRRS